MDEKTAIQVATALTTALIQVGFVPPAAHRKTDTAAEQAVVLFHEVLQQLRNDLSGNKL